MKRLGPYTVCNIFAWGPRPYPDPRWDLSFVLRKKIQGRTARLLKLKVPGISRSEMNVVCLSVRGSEARIRIGEVRAPRPFTNWIAAAAI